MAPPPPPVLILASRESGGSRLAALLGAHPQLAGAPHLNLLAFPEPWQLRIYSTVPRDVHIHGLYRFVAETLLGEQTLQALQAARRWIGLREDAPSAALHAALRGLHAPRRLVDYSPLLVQSAAAMRRALAAVPGATVIHLVRHPLRHGHALRYPVWQTTMASMSYWADRALKPATMDVFEIGEHLVDWSATPVVFDPQFAWHREQANAAAVAAEADADWITLRDEDLAADPAGQTARLLARLGVADDRATVQAMLAAGPGPYAAPGPFDAPFGIDFEMLEHGPATAFAAPPVPVSDDPEAPLPWRGDGEALLPPVVALARRFGYFSGRSVTSAPPGNPARTRAKTAVGLDGG